MYPYNSTEKKLENTNEKKKKKLEQDIQMANIHINSVQCHC